MIEEQYLVYQCYGVTQGEKEEDIIYRAAGKTYLDFRRRISFQGMKASSQDVFLFYLRIAGGALLLPW